MGGVKILLFTRIIEGSRACALVIALLGSHITFFILLATLKITYLAKSNRRHLTRMEWVNWFSLRLVTLTTFFFHRSMLEHTYP